MKLFKNEKKNKPIKTQNKEKKLKLPKVLPFRVKKEDHSTQIKTEELEKNKRKFFVFNKKKNKPAIQPEVKSAIAIEPINKPPVASIPPKPIAKPINTTLVKRIGCGFGIACALLLGIEYINSPNFRYRNYNIEPDAPVIKLEIGDSISKDLLDYLELPDDFPTEKIKVTTSDGFDSRPNLGECEITYEYNDQQVNLVFDVEDTTAPVLTKKQDIHLFENQTIQNIHDYLNVEDYTKVDLIVDDKDVIYDTPGEYNVIVTATDTSGNSSEINVPIVVEALNLKNETPYLQIVEGDSSNLLYTSNSNNKIDYSGYDKDIITVTDQGVVRAANAGTTTVIGTIEGQSVESTIEVIPAYVYLNYSNLSLIESGSYSLSATTNSKTNKVSFSSSNTSVVKVNDRGELTAVKEGEAIVYAKVNGKTAECKVNVKPVFLEFNKEQTSIYRGNSGYVGVSTNSPKQIVYSSSDTNVVTVDEWGNIYGAGVGTAIITVSGSGKKDTISVTVSEAPAPVSRNTSGGSATGSPSASYVINTNTGKFHHSWCGSVKQMKESNKWYYEGSRDEIVNMGYIPCKKCNP